MKKNHHKILNDQSISKFNDEIFTPTISSLILNNTNDPLYERTPQKYIEEFKTYKWLRLNEIFKSEDYKIFQNQLQPEEINQGALGSCYLLSPLISLVQNEERVKKLLVTQVVNTKGIYAVRFLIQGEYKIVTIDDYFPCKAKDNKPAFATSKFKEIYVMLLEKAWAKINHSCYMRTWMGLPNEAMSALFEAPSYYECHLNFIQNTKENVLWNKILNAINRKWIVCADTEEIKNENELGLSPFHAYCVLNVFDIKELNLKLLKIRNPSGDKTFIGDYSPHSIKWTTRLKELIGYHELIPKKGIFFISFQDFLKYFPFTFYCKYEDTFHYCYSKFILNKDKPEIIYNKVEYNLILNFNQTEMIPIKSYSNLNTRNIYKDFFNLNQFVSAIIEVTKNTKCYIVLHQPQQRFLKIDENVLDNNPAMEIKNDNKINQDKCSSIGLIILTKFEKNSHKLISSDFINRDKIELDVNLSQGEYHIFCKSFHTNNPLELVISTYAEYPIEIYKFPQTLFNKNWLEEILLNQARNNKEKKYFSKKEKKSFSSNILMDNINLGYGIFYYENKSKNGILNINIYFSQLKGIKILNFEGKSSCHNTDTFYEIKVNPGESNAMFIEFLNISWNCSVKWNHILWYDYPAEIIVKENKGSKDTIKQQIDKNIIIYTIKYEGGYVIMTDNGSKYRYIIKFNFDNFDEFETDSIMIINEIEFIINSKSKSFVKIRHKDMRNQTIPIFKITQLKL